MAKCDITKHFIYHIVNEHLLEDEMPLQKNWVANATIFDSCANCIWSETMAFQLHEYPNRKHVLRQTDSTQWI